MSNPMGQYMSESDLCTKLEHYITPKWAVDEILKVEDVGTNVFDPCCGTGVLAEAAMRRDRLKPVYCMDIHDWGYQYQCETRDFLTMDSLPLSGEFTVLMNPPFSKACEFVSHSLALGARKIICFQRFAWWESRGRRDFWRAHPPSRVYICGDRATCWRHDLPVNERGKRCDPKTGKELGGSSTAHAWFVWDGEPPYGETRLKHIYNKGK